MAQTPEGKVKTWLKRLLLREWPDCWIYWAPGGRYGRKGVPDALCCIEGLFVAIEVKADKTKGPTDYQKDELDLIAKADGISCLLRGKDMVKFNKLVKVINKYVKRIKEKDIVQAK